MPHRIGIWALCAALGAFLMGCTSPSDDGGAMGNPSVIPSAGNGNGTAGAGQGTAGTPGTGGSSGGMTGTSGAAGNATAGSGGMSMAGAAGAGGAAGDGKSAGCGKVPADEPHKYVQHDIAVNVAAAYQPKFATRKYYTYLPNNYDPDKKYPLIFYGAGCGAKMSENQPAMGVFNDQAILVFLLQVDDCFQAGSKGTADSPDIPYFDTALTEIENNYCIDKDRVFASGYSSGGWLSITLSCSHGDKLRGIAIAAGGQQPVLPACTGPVAALFFVSSGDDTNPIGGATGSGMARDRLLTANGCMPTMDPNPWDARWPYCKKYTGCDQNPVVWCDHGGGHSNGQAEKMASDGWWKFFTELP